MLSRIPKIARQRWSHWKEKSTHLCDGNEHIIDATHFVESKPCVEPQYGANDGNNGERYCHASDSISGSVATCGHLIELKGSCSIDTLFTRDEQKVKSARPCHGLVGICA